MAVGICMASIGTTVLLAPGAFILARRSCLTRGCWIWFDRALEEGILLIFSIALLERIECFGCVLVGGSKGLEFGNDIRIGDVRKRL